MDRKRARALERELEKTFAKTYGLLQDAREKLDAAEQHVVDIESFFEQVVMKALKEAGK